MKNRRPAYAPPVPIDGVNAGESVGSVRLAGLTRNDIEAEALARLARGGYEWTALRAGRRSTS